MNKTIEFIIFLVLILSKSVVSQNCSTYNPCGQHGYCENDSNGSWECVCKFWWIGAFCNQLSSSGIQVITLSAVVGILIVIFYGLAIVSSIRQKRKQPKKEKKKNNPNDLGNPKLSHMALTTVKQSARFSSCLSAILTIIIAVISLIIKWLLLQPIHNEIVRKHINQEPLYYTRISFCDIIDLEDFNVLTLPIAALVILIFIVFSKRTSCSRKKLNGYIAPVIPLDFYINVKRKFFAAVFAAIADELLSIVNEVINGDTPKVEGVILVYLLQIVKVLIIGFHFYPILAGVYIDSILSLTCATLYAWLNFSLSIIYQGSCQSDFYTSDDTYARTNETSIEIYFDFYGTGQNLIIIQLISDVPRYICWAYIVTKLPMLLINKIYRKIKQRNENQGNHLHLTLEEKVLLHSSIAHSVEMSYVRNLFRPVNQRTNSRSFIARLIPKFIYKWRDDFRFSSRVLCVYSSLFLLLYFMTMQTILLVVPYLNSLQAAVQTIIDGLTGSSDPSLFPLPNFTRSYIFAILTSFVITTIQLLVLLASIRRNLFQIFRGDNSEIPRRDKSKYIRYSTGNFHFAGYFIGYLIWGYILTAALAFLIYICIDSFITYGSVKILETILKKIIPVLLLIFFKQYINDLLARYVFLQHYGDILAINNRRLLMIFLYFNFFLDAFLGFISSIIRILKSIIGGFLYMSRLDYSPLGRKLETLDAGFSAYCGFLHIEAVHRNPIMLAVASHLYSQMKAKQYAAKNSLTTTNQGKNYSSKGIRKWHLAVLFIRYPSLVFLRKDRFQNDHNQLEDLNAMKRKQSCVEPMRHRPSLVTEIELQNIWQNKH